MQALVQRKKKDRLLKLGFHGTNHYQKSEALELGKLGDARREMASLSEEPWPSSAAGYQLGPKIGEVRPRERVGAVL